MDALKKRRTEAAVASVRSKAMNISEAAKEFRLHRMYIARRLRGDVAMYSMRGYSRLLTPQQEQVVLDTVRAKIRQLQRCLTPTEMADVMRECVQPSDAARKLPKNFPSHRLIRSFVERHRKSTTTRKPLADGSTKAPIKTSSPWAPDPVKAS
ncbi:hypothetical protein H310_05077 [Aphanomyces invadans]|uniref:HTH psq-type domain-containing protein n=1 Tax=Aphanomyces invadans TaxID=157072 RepID=A0A024UB95_9STRA|nr:hypothetical protein H310_05077 [Aphanomyces invadans]ETW03691.1 hypothetical protein H310_05077 [Aphanomyces invadans]|eukprot:XP_008867920.1 hypothetical protein H310_05077 [Aphanomyces invadans]